MSTVAIPQIGGKRKAFGEWLRIWAGKRGEQTPKETYAVERFIEEFALPLIVGGGLQVGRPWSRDQLLSLQVEGEVGTELAQRLEKARRRQAGKLWLHPLSLPLDETTAQVMVGLYDLMFLSHPAVEHLFFAKRKITVQHRSKIVIKGYEENERLILC